MGILVSHSSALEFIRAHPSLSRASLSEIDVDLREFDPKPSSIVEVQLRAQGVAGHPHTILAHRSRRSSSSNRFRVYGMTRDQMPERLILSGDPISCCGPELVFLQMSQRLSPLGSIVLGYELCGSYSHFAPRISGFYDRDPLTTIDDISRAADALTGMNGVRRARRTLPNILEKSASPMKTVLACMLTLPAKMGGFGFAKPELNRRVELDDAARSLTGTRYCKVDVGWAEQRIAFEYDSDLSHPDPVKDRRRREALLHMGWKVFTVDLRAITQFNELLKVVNLIENVVPKHMGSAESISDDPADLHRRLLKATRFGLGMGRALFADGEVIDPRRIHI